MSFSPSPETALVITLALLVYYWVIVGVGKARKATGIKPPATTGHITLEKALRVQHNMLEQFIVFLPAVVLFDRFVSSVGAALLGLVWIVGRVIYARAYMQDPETRGTGFGIALVPQTLLLLGALIGSAVSLLRSL